MKKFIAALGLSLAMFLSTCSWASGQEQACVSVNDWVSNQTAQAAKDGIKLDFVAMTGEALAKFKVAMLDNIRENGQDPGKYEAPYDLIMWAAFEMNGEKYVGLAGFVKNCNVETTVWSAEHFFMTIKKAFGPKEIGKGSI